MNIAQPEQEIFGEDSCTSQTSELHGVVWLIQECDNEPDIFWVLTSYGPIVWTAPLFRLNGDQQIDGNLDVSENLGVGGNVTVEGDCAIHGHLTLLPTSEPDAPSAGCRLYAGHDGYLKIKYADNSIRSLGAAYDSVI